MKGGQFSKGGSRLSRSFTDRQCLSFARCGSRLGAAWNRLRRLRLLFKLLLSPWRRVQSSQTFARASLHG
eukprot:7439058-Pyramimonas_sp.AAC.1